MNVGLFAADDVVHPPPAGAQCKTSCYLNAERFSDWCLVEVLLTHDSDAERFSAWLSG